MLQFFDKIHEQLQVVEKSEASAIRQSVDVLTEAILNKKSLFIFGASHAGILAEELYYRAGGLMLMNAIFGKELSLDTQPISHTSRMERLEGYGVALADTVPFKEGDVLIVHSVSGRNPVSIDLALKAKEKGVRIIVLTNISYSKQTTSRHSSGLLLYEVGDIVIDNHGEVGDACCEIDGLEQKVGPTSTVIGATILNTMVVEVAKQLKQQGMDKPPIFYSANLDGGDELNRKLFKEYSDVIHYDL